jgi:hypothetical protein
MISRLTEYLRDLRDRQRLNIALTKGTASIGARKIDLTNPRTWEFSGFSQNGEDGILDVLRSQVLNPNKYFVEIGASDGIENNCAWLLVTEQYSGLMVEGNVKLAKRANRLVVKYGLGAECHHKFVTRDSVAWLKSMAFHSDPDVFSLDIDGNDYHIAQAVLEIGFRPKIFVVEYNSVFGPHRKVTIPYDPKFAFSEADPTWLYYGVSIAGWKSLFARHGYRFVTVESHGVNAFFVDPAQFNEPFLADIRGLEFAENLFQYTKFRMPSEQQFELIANRAFIAI